MDERGRTERAFMPQKGRFHQSMGTNGRCSYGKEAANEPIVCVCFRAEPPHFGAQIEKFSSGSPMKLTVQRRRFG